MDRRFIRRLRLRCFTFSIHPTQLENGLSVHPKIPCSSLLFFGLDPQNIFACDIFASMGPRNAYKDMLNNMVSLIDHVVINHQNQTQTNGIEAMFATVGLWLLGQIRYFGKYLSKFGNLLKYLGKFGTHKPGTEFLQFGIYQFCFGSQYFVLRVTSASSVSRHTPLAGISPTPHAPHLPLL
jgi:hypothetical protein